MLTLFDPATHHKVYADSSKDGVRAVLLQEDDDGWRPVAYLSKSMIKSEIEYAQVEKESLAITTGIIKFHSYLYGLKFEVESDNHPRCTIFSRGLSLAPGRIQGFMLKLQKYDFHVGWVSRKYITTDSLSKVHRKGTHVNLLKMFLAMPLSSCVR